jgi:hypothetical protein
VLSGVPREYAPYEAGQPSVALALVVNWAAELKGK